MGRVPTGNPNGRPRQMRPSGLKTLAAQVSIVVHGRVEMLATELGAPKARVMDEALRIALGLSVRAPEIRSTIEKNGKAVNEREHQAEIARTQLLRIDALERTINHMSEVIGNLTGAEFAQREINRGLQESNDHLIRKLAELRDRVATVERVIDVAARTRFGARPAHHPEQKGNL